MGKTIVRYYAKKSLCNNDYKTQIARKYSNIPERVEVKYKGRYDNFYGIWAEVKIIGMQFLDFFDFISNSVLMPIVALITCIFVGYVIKPSAIIEEVELTGQFKRKAVFEFIIKYLAPICIILILISSVGIIKIWLNFHWL